MPIHFSATVVSFCNYFALTTLYGIELIITINSSQLVKLLPFLLSYYVSRNTRLCILRSQYSDRSQYI